MAVCETCKHCVAQFGRGYSHLWRCRHPEAMRTNHQTGRPEPDWCSMRNRHGDCRLHEDGNPPMGVGPGEILAIGVWACVVIAVASGVRSLMGGA